jgi:hypothetical protein
MHELDSVRLVIDKETSGVESSCFPAASPTRQHWGGGFRVWYWSYSPAGNDKLTTWRSYIFKINFDCKFILDEFGLSNGTHDR